MTNKQYDITPLTCTECGKRAYTMFIPEYKFVIFTTNKVIHKKLKNVQMIKCSKCDEQMLFEKDMSRWVKIIDKVEDYQGWDEE